MKKYNMDPNLYKMHQAYNSHDKELFKVCSCGKIPGLMFSIMSNKDYTSEFDRLLIFNIKMGNKTIAQQFDVYIKSKKKKFKYYVDKYIKKKYNNQKGGRT